MSNQLDRRQLIRGITYGSAALAALSVAPWGASGQDTGRPVVFGMWSAPQMVSPHTTNSTYSLVHSDLIFSTLTR